MAEETWPSQMEEDVDSNSEADVDDLDDDDGPAIGRRGRRTGRGVNLSMLLSDGILQPGEGMLTIDYLGRKFGGDLLPNGKIRWQETRQLFNSPSAWAIYCKKCINPEKKSGCGWASVKYDGRKLDYYKSLWFRKHKAIDSLKSNDEDDDDKMNGAEHGNGVGTDDAGEEVIGRAVVAHSSLGVRCSDNDPNTLVGCTSFSALGKIQPFTVTVASSCLFLMDFHCHLTTSEVVGYLGGAWNIGSHNLAVTQAFPCDCRLGDKENGPLVEERIRTHLERQHLSLVGWYHSHPSCRPEPTLRDITSQIDYQIRLKGTTDAAYTPCIGIICSPYDQGKDGCESAIQAYWVMPPPENKPLEYGRPMSMGYNVANDASLNVSEMVAEMNKLYDYYKAAPDLVGFNNEWADDGTTYLDKLQSSLAVKRPADVSEEKVGEILQQVLKGVC